MRQRRLRINSPRFLDGQFSTVLSLLRHIQLRFVPKNPRLLKD